MSSSMDELTSNLNKEHFRKTRKYLDLLYFQQPNQPQTNTETEGREESEALHVLEDYRNYL